MAAVSTYLATCTAGMEDILKQELDNIHGGDSSYAVQQAIHGGVVFTTALIPQSLVSLRAADNLYAFLALMQDVPSHPKDVALDHLEQLPHKIDWRAALQLHRMWTAGEDSMLVRRCCCQNSSSMSTSSNSTVGGEGQGVEMLSTEQSLFSGGAAPYRHANAEDDSLDFHDLQHRRQQEQQQQQQQQKQQEQQQQQEEEEEEGELNQMKEQRGRQQEQLQKHEVLVVAKRKVEEPADGLESPLPLFRVTCHRVCVKQSKHSFSSPEAAGALGAGIHGTLGWPVSMRHFNLEVLAWIRDSELLLAVSLIYSPQADNHRLPGQANTSAAAKATEVDGPPQNIRMRKAPGECGQGEAEGSGEVQGDVVQRIDPVAAEKSKRARVNADSDAGKHGGSRTAIDRNGVVQSVPQQQKNHHHHEQQQQQQSKEQQKCITVDCRDTKGVVNDHSSEGVGVGEGVGDGECAGSRAGGAGSGPLQARSHTAHRQLYAWRCHRRSYVKTSLKPSTAYALMQLANVEPGHIVVDPMCGGGTIPLEAHDWLNSKRHGTHPDSMPRGHGHGHGHGGTDKGDDGRGMRRVWAFGGDVDAASIAVAERNSVCQGSRGCQENSVCGGGGEGEGGRSDGEGDLERGRSGSSRRCDFVLWDACRLPLRSGCVDRVVCDMPFGNRCGTFKTREKLSPRVLAEVARVLVPGSGRAVLMAQCRSMRDSLESTLSPFLTVEQHVHAEMEGLRVDVFVLQRSSLPPSSAGSAVAAPPRLGLNGKKGMKGQWIQR